MKLGEQGEAFFVHEDEENELNQPHGENFQNFVTSPIESPVEDDQEHSDDSESSANSAKASAASSSSSKSSTKNKQRRSSKKALKNPSDHHESENEDSDIENEILTEIYKAEVEYKKTRSNSKLTLSKQAIRTIKRNYSKTSHNTYSRKPASKPQSQSVDDGIAFSPCSSPTDTDTNMFNSDENELTTMISETSRSVSNPNNLSKISHQHKRQNSKISLENQSLKKELVENIKKVIDQSKSNSLIAGPNDDIEWRYGKFPEPATPMEPNQSFTLPKPREEPQRYRKDSSTQVENGGNSMVDSTKNLEDLINSEPNVQQSYLGHGINSNHPKYRLNSQSSLNSETIFSNHGLDLELSIYARENEFEPIEGAKWDANKVDFLTFQKNPFDILNNPNLMVKYDKIYLPWRAAAPYLVSLLIFGQQLDSTFGDKTRLRNLSMTQQNENLTKFEPISNSNLNTQASEINRIEKSKSVPAQSPPPVATTTFFGGLISKITRSPQASLSETVVNGGRNSDTISPLTSDQVVQTEDLPGPPKDLIINDLQPLQLDINVDNEVEDIFKSKPLISPTENFTVTPLLEEDQIAPKLETSVSIPENIPENELTMTEIQPPEENNPPKTVTPIDEALNSPETEEDQKNRRASTQYKKSLSLSSEQLKRLNLKYGRNEIIFSVTTQFQGTSKCAAAIYLYSYNDKIVVSDIDGTITKSDALGMLLPAVGAGTGWTHDGVARLYNKITANNYKFVYLKVGVERQVSN